MKIQGLESPWTEKEKEPTQRPPDVEELKKT